MFVLALIQKKLISKAIVCYSNVNKDKRRVMCDSQFPGKKF